ncbi:peptidyl-prolyl cis-trans isomerase B (cyclophilin B) [Peptococcaceae bacterium DYL19]|nr:peptidylprolyl isomerase [Phosphitispora fastidiosa]MBU7006224.1 peptidyl-prolyl cis-trans isomerase B (cyclophilin B) [Phosphitispora fastidiosa]
MMAANPVVSLETANDKTIKIELFPEIAPNTVKNFVSLVKKGFYDGLSFHRVIPGFMVQGGCPQGTGGGGPGYSIKGEFNSNKHVNNLIHERGVISMARTMDPNSAGSQFFIMVQDSPHLDGEYAAFGKVTEGMDEVDRVVNADRDFRDKPVADQLIKKATVDTFGVDYGEPEKA